MTPVFLAVMGRPDPMHFEPTSHRSRFRCHTMVSGGAMLEVDHSRALERPIMVDRPAHAQHCGHRWNRRRRRTSMEHRQR